MDVAVVGNSTIHAGFAMAADLAMAGHAVRLAAWPGAEARLEPIRRRGGLELAGNAAHSVSGRTGLAKPKLAETLADAVAGAEVVLLDMPAAEYEARFASLVEHLRPSQVVHVGMHGYWPALRLAPILRAAGQTGVAITEGTAPTVAADASDGVVTLQCRRRRLPVAAFPASRAADALPRLEALYPDIVPAGNVLETGFHGLNMMIHAPLVLLNVGACDRAAAAGAPADLYGIGNTRHTGVLAAAQDAERAPACAAYGLPFRSLAQTLRDCYGASGETIEELVRTCGYYRDLPAYPAEAWQRWLLADVPHAHVPMVQLAELAGVAMPLHRAVIAIAGALLARDFWATGVTLERLGLAGRDAAAIRRYVETGTLD